MAIKLRTVIKHPAQVEGGTGINVEKENGVYSYSIDFSEFVEADTIPDASVAFVPFYTEGDPDVYGRISLEEFAELAAAAIDEDLAALAANSTNGFWTRTGAGTGEARTLTASTGLAWTNPAGAAGNPNVAFDLNALTVDASPDPVTDYLVTYDVSAGAHRKVLVGTAVGSVGSVTSLNGQTGVLTLSAPGTIFNLGLAASVAGNALTIALKNAAGADPSASSPVVISFRSATAATGTPSTLSVAAAASLVISSGSTLGATNNTPFNLIVVGFNDGGTFRLGVMNSSASGVIYPCITSGIASSTTEGGAGGADSAGVFYTETAVTSKAYVVLGRLAWTAAPLATAGTWANGPDVIRLVDEDFKFPGEVIQVQTAGDSAYNSGGTTLIPFDDTIPQNTEGQQAYTVTITPTSQANFLNISSKLYLGCNAVTNVVSAIFQDSTANALAADVDPYPAAHKLQRNVIDFTMLANTASATTFKSRFGGDQDGIYTVNGTAAQGRFFGGVLWSHLIVTEIQG